MGLFDSINSIFGSSAGQDAANKAAAANAAALNTYQGTANNLYNQYQTSSLGALGSTSQQALGQLGTGLTNQVNALNAGQAGATAAGQAGVAGYQPLQAATDAYQPLVTSYYNALNGSPQDRAATVQQFQSTPGYQFQQDEAARAVAANASKLGIAASGNTLQTLGDRSQNIADTTYNQYLDRLGAFVPLQQQGYSTLGAGLAGANKTLADIFSSGGQALSGAYGTNAAQQAGIYGQLGQNQTDVYGNTVQGQAQAARDVSQGTLASNNAVAQATQQDAANNMGFWSALAGSAAKAFAPTPTK